MMIKLTDIQLVLLTTAAQRPDGNLLPPPETLVDQMPRLRRGILGLLKHTLVEEIAIGDPANRWREENGTCFGLVITAAGRAAIGVETVVPAEPPAAPAPRPTKIAMVLDLLRRDGGATIAELTAATEWLPHTMRAALTGLRKKGHIVEKQTRQDATAYVVKAAV